MEGGLVGRVGVGGQCHSYVDDSDSKRLGADMRAFLQYADMQWEMERVMRGFSVNVV